MLDTRRSGDILEIRLARPPVNALNPELLTGLRDAVRAAPGDGARGIVIAGGPKVFSAGLDVPHLLTLDRPDLEAAWRVFFEAAHTIAASPVPVVAAIAGHGHEVTVFDPQADVAEAREEYGLELAAAPGSDYDCVVGAVPHSEFDDLSLKELVAPGGLVADVKGIWRNRSLPENLRYWSL